MIVGPGRIKIPRASSSNEGLVVQAVLVMALVTTIGVLITAARVAASRQSSASASTSQAARQAAEYGYSEIIAEMNRDSKSYLWVTNSLIGATSLLKILRLVVWLRAPTLVRIQSLV